MNKLNAMYTAFTTVIVPKITDAVKTYIKYILACLLVLLICIVFTPLCAILLVVVGTILLFAFRHYDELKEAYDNSINKKDTK